MLFDLSDKSQRMCTVRDESRQTNDIAVKWTLLRKLNINIKCYTVMSLLKFKPK